MYTNYDHAKEQIAPVVVSCSYNICTHPCNIWQFLSLNKHAPALIFIVFIVFQDHLQTFLWLTNYSEERQCASKNESNCCMVQQQLLPYLYEMLVLTSNFVT